MSTHSNSKQQILTRTQKNSTVHTYKCYVRPNRPRDIFLVRTNIQTRRKASRQARWQAGKHSQVTYDSNSDSSELLPADYVVIVCILVVSMFVACVFSSFWVIAQKRPTEMKIFIQPSFYYERKHNTKRGTFKAKNGKNSKRR